MWKSNNIQFIKDSKIAETLKKTDLIITDYSSIIFDIIYRKKPYIIFIPDGKDPNIKNNYNERTYNVIKNFTNKDFDFKNVFFDINSTIQKTKYYIIINKQIKIIWFKNIINNCKNIHYFINFILCIFKIIIHYILNAGVIYESVWFTCLRFISFEQSNFFFKFLIVNTIQ